MIGCWKAALDSRRYRIAPGQHCIDQHHIGPARPRIALARRHIDPEQGRTDSALLDIAAPFHLNSGWRDIACSIRKDFWAATPLWHFALAQARNSLSCARDRFYAASSFL